MSLTSNQGSGSNARKRVLVVDDDPIQCEFAQMKLNSGDIEVATATSVQTGLARLAKEAFDLVLTDYNMPGRNGLELIAAMRADARTRKIPIILVTSSEELSTINAAYRAGIAAFALKPVKWNVLEMQVRKALRAGEVS